MPNNDYWAYLRDENELKHYRTPGTPNKVHKYTDIDANGNYIYDDKVAAAQARGQARQQQASRDAKRNLQLIDERQGGNSHSGYSGTGNHGYDGRGDTRRGESDLSQLARQRGSQRAKAALNVINERPQGGGASYKQGNGSGNYGYDGREEKNDDLAKKAQARGQARAQQEAERQRVAEIKGSRTTEARSEKAQRVNKYTPVNSDAAKREMRIWNSIKYRGGVTREEVEDLEKYGIVGVKLRNAAKSAKNKADEIGSKIKSAVSGAAAKAKEGITGTTAEIKRGITGTVDKAKKLKKKYFGGN